MQPQTVTFTSLPDGSRTWHMHSGRHSLDAVRHKISAPSPVKLIIILSLKILLSTDCWQPSEMWLYTRFPLVFPSPIEPPCSSWPLAVRSVHFSPLTIGSPRRRDMRDNSAEILFQCFLQEAIVSSSGMGRDVSTLWCFPSSISSADQGVAHSPRCPEERFWRASPSSSFCVL